MEHVDHAKSADVFRAFADEKRLNIIDMLSVNEQNASVLLDSMNISQSTLSHHMKILCESGVVESRRDGKWTYYSLNTEGVNTAIEYLYSIQPTKHSRKVKAKQTAPSIPIAPADADGERVEKPTVRSEKSDAPVKKKRSGSDDMSWLF